MPKKGHTEEEIVAVLQQVETRARFAFDALPDNGDFLIGFWSFSQTSS